MKIRLPYPHPGQIAVREQAKRFNWLSAGRRWRKTTMAMAIAVESAAQGAEIIWGAPTADQVMTCFEETERACRGEAIYKRSYPMEAKLPGGGRILYRSMDNPESARSKTADGIVTDEVGDVKEQAYYGVLRPMLIDTGGWFWGIGTPKGFNWFRKEWTKAKDSPTDSMSWQVPTLGVEITPNGLRRKPHPLENPNIPFKEVLKAWEDSPEKFFKQEYLADFVADAGAVFRKVREAASAKPKEKTPYLGGCVFGVDWGKVQDFTVIVAIDTYDKSMMAMDRFNQIDWHFQRGRLKAMYDKYKPISIIAEWNSMGDPNCEELQREGLPVHPFVTTNQTKKEIIEALALAFEKGEIKILPDEILMTELEGFEVSRTPSGLLKYGAPGQLHDDCVMALALAWQGAAHGGMGKIETTPSLAGRADW